MVSICFMSKDRKKTKGGAATNSQLYEAGATLLLQRQQALHSSKCL